MKKTIWKYKVSVEADRFSIQMPKDSEILCMQEQFGSPCMWVLADPDQEIEERFFETFGTGRIIHYDMGVDRKYIDTYQLNNGGLVFHVFERIN